MNYYLVQTNQSKGKKRDFKEQDMPTTFGNASVVPCKLHAHINFVGIVKSLLLKIRDVRRYVVIMYCTFKPGKWVHQEQYSRESSRNMVLISSLLTITRLLANTPRGC